MKLIILIVCIGFLSVAVFGKDLSSIARKERARRQSIHASRAAKAFTNDDLDALAERTAAETSGPRPQVQRPAGNDSRERRKEELFWRGEKLRNDRELARLDANIRRLEWRLRDRTSKTRTDNGLREDPAVALLEESLESLRDQRRQLELDFRDRARKAGAFPGWLR